MATSADPAPATSSWEGAPEAWDRERVLDFGPSTHAGGRWRHRVELLWPVLAWRVTVSAADRPALDPLQQVVLRLRSAGVMDARELAGWVGLEPELFEQISAELHEQELIDLQGRLTKAGRAALEDLLPAARSLRSGWIFRDAVSGSFFPRFAPELQELGVETDRGGRPQIVRGTRAAPVHDQALVVPADMTARALTPTEGEILEQLQRHRRDQRRLQRARVELSPLLAPVATRVVGLSEAPEAYHLHTFLYVPEDGEVAPEPWLVAEPFGFGASPQLRGALAGLLERLEPAHLLRRRFDQILGRQIERVRRDWEAMDELLRDEAERQVRDGLPPHPRDEQARHALIAGFVAVARERERAQRAPPPPIPAHEIAVSLRLAVEQALAALHDLCPPGDAWQVLFAARSKGSDWSPLSKSQRRARLEACARDVGFPGVPRSLVGTAPGRVREAAARRDASNLRPALAVLLLSAQADPSHPLRRVAAASPDWLRRVDELAEHAGGSVHGGSRQRVRLQDVQGWADSALNLCRELFAAMSSDAPRAQEDPRPHG